jgi:hypothetical protein
MEISIRRATCDHGIQRGDNTVVQKSDQIKSIKKLTTVASNPASNSDQGIHESAQTHNSHKPKSLVLQHDARQRKQTQPSPGLICSPTKCTANPKNEIRVNAKMRDEYQSNDEPSSIPRRTST